MKKKIINIQKNNQSPKRKLVAYLTALTLGISTISIPVAANDISQVESISIEENKEANKNYILNTLYQKQKDYLDQTVRKLKNFYETTDTKNIIKNAYPNEYNLVNNYETSNDFNITDYVFKIKEQNQIIKNLRIKPDGNGREPDYGIIPDFNSTLGFRIKTEEDRTLIDQYTCLLQNPILVNDNLLDLLEQNTLDYKDLVNALESILSDQLNYIKNTQKKLNTFYQENDINKIITNAYPEAYEASLKQFPVMYGYYGNGYGVVRDNSKTVEELINEYLEAIKENNKTICALKIKPAGNGREPDYGIIPDFNSALGFRIKTQEDNELIDTYTDLIGNLEDVPFPVVNYLESLSQEKENSMVKTYENR